MDSPEIFALLLGAVVIVSLVAIIGGFLQVRRERLLAHQERMKALELGRDLPDDVATGRVKAILGGCASGEGGDGASLARKCFSTALWVGFWGFLAAANGAWMNPAIAIAIAASAGAIGVTAMICGTTLASQTLSTPASGSGSPSKPFVESDAFDVVSRRG